MKSRVTLVAIASVFLGCGFYLGSRDRNDSVPPQPDRPQASAEPRLDADEQQTVEVFERVSRSVVNIQNNALTLVRRRFTLFEQEVPQGTGSGVVWDEQGHIVTNYHVVANANSLTVTLADGSEYKVPKEDFIGGYADKDMAVLRIRAPREKLHPVTVGSSKNLRVGMKALAIGNPFGLDQTLTTGVISALEREMQAPNGRRISGVIQTDAAVNRGNSGGPLLNSRGELIGITTAILSPSGTSAGIAFAVPVDTVARVVNDFIRHGRIIRPGLGIVPVDDRRTRSYGIEKGVLIHEVGADTAAAEGGLRGTRIHRNRDGELVELGDIIVSVGDRAIVGRDDLLDALEAHSVGDKVEITYLRRDQSRKTTVTLQQIQRTR